MSAVTRIDLVDDLDGTPALHTVLFGLDEGRYEIDLNEGNLNVLRHRLARYVRVARRV